VHEAVQQRRALADPPKAPPGRTLTEMWLELDEGAKLFSDLWNADVPRICVENPVMHKYAKERIVNYVEPAQSVQPWQFGHGECKRTCFWLKNLPPARADRRSSTAATSACTWRHPGPTGGRSAAASIPASPRPWPSSGAG
jgi:hypothetical protein